MKKFALVVMLGVAGSASAQQPSAVLCNPSSYEFDAVKAAPDSHRVIFEDEHVRVLEIILPPLAVEPIHVHALPSVIQGETGGTVGAKFLYTTYKFEGGKFVQTEQSEITPTPGYRTVWSGPEGPHSIANIGPVPVRFQRIEIKPERCAK